MMFIKDVQDSAFKTEKFRHLQVGEPSLTTPTKMTEEDFQAFKSMQSAKTVHYVDTRQRVRVIYQIKE